MEEKKEITCVEQCETLSDFWSFTEIMHRQKPRRVSLQEMYKYGELKAKEAVESKFIPEEYTKDDLKKFESNSLTVGKLKKFLDEHLLADNAIVVVQRV